MTTQPQIGEAAKKLSHSLANLAGSTAGYLGARVDQFDDACRAERRRLAWMLLSATAALLWAVIATVLAGVAIIMNFRDTHPVAAICAVAGGFVLLAGAAAWTCWRLASRRGSLAERLTTLITLLLQRRSPFP